MKTLKEAITSCKKCSRLRSHCQKIAQEKRKSFAGDTYWAKPVAGFGVERAALVVVGLAPAAHGANRTGRVFTGDRSGDWLYRALFKAGYANQPTSTGRSDGLELTNCFVTATVKCAPPDNKPTPTEIRACLPYLKREFELLQTAQVYIALGKIAFDQTWNLLKQFGWADGPRPAFKHLAVVKLPHGRWLIASYHPSQQNTFTGKLTEPMFDSVFDQARKLIV